MLSFISPWIYFLLFFFGQMKEVLDPPASMAMAPEALDPPASMAMTPETENAASSCTRKIVGNDVIAERDAVSLCQTCMCPGSFPSKRNIILIEFTQSWILVLILLAIFLSHSAGDSMKSEEDADFFRHANRALSLLVRTYLSLWLSLLTITRVVLF